MIQWQDEHFQACAQAQEHLANPNQAHSESYEDEEEMGRAGPGSTHLVLHRVVYDRVRKRKNYFEIPAFPQINEENQEWKIQNIKWK